MILPAILGSTTDFQNGTVLESIRSFKDSATGMSSSLKIFYKGQNHISTKIPHVPKSIWYLALVPDKLDGLQLPYKRDEMLP